MINLDITCNPLKCCCCVYEEWCSDNTLNLHFELACKKEIQIRLSNNRYVSGQRSEMEQILKGYDQGWIKERETKKKENMENKEKTYEQGLEEAWGIAKKVGLESLKGGYTRKELKSIFGDKTWIDILHDMSIDEVRSKITAYEAKQNKPKLGDVVKCGSLISNATLIGILSNENERTYSVMLKGKSGVTYQDLYKDCWTIEKTGKHFDIQSMLDEIG